MTTKDARAIYANFLKLADHVGMPRQFFNDKVEEYLKDSEKTPLNYLITGCMVLLPYLDEHVQWKDKKTALVADPWLYVFIISQRLLGHAFQSVEPAINEYDVWLLKEVEKGKNKLDKESEK